MMNQWSSFCVNMGSLRGRGLQRAGVLGVLADCKMESHPHRFYSSKTPIKSSVTTALDAGAGTSRSQKPFIPHFSGYDIRELDNDTRIKLKTVSSGIAQAQSSSLVSYPVGRRRKEILKMDESEYENTSVLRKKMPLLDARGEGQSYYMRAFEPDKRNNIDMLSFFQADIDLRPEAVKRWWATMNYEKSIEAQEYNPKRNRILGNDLAAAHFIVFRQGKIRFMGHTDWVTEYRKDARPGAKEEDLPVMKFELCNLPINYDPRYRVEAIDATGVDLHYEGLANFENLHYLKWLSVSNSVYINDWCLDRIARMFEKLEYIDLSGCKNVTDKGIGTLHRCKRLKTIKVEHMSHVENLEIVCALLEDHLPELEVIGIDYAAKMEKLRLEGEEFERKAKDQEALLEASTVTIESINEPGPDSKTASDMNTDANSNISISNVPSKKAFH